MSDPCDQTEFTLEGVSAGEFLSACLNPPEPTQRLRELMGRRGWRTIDDGAPMDGTPLLLFARCKTAAAPAIVIGWHMPDRGWIEAAYSPNAPIGLVPTHWMPLPGFPR